MEDVEDIELRIESLVQGNVRTETLSLDGFPKRAEYSMRLQLETLFLDEKTCRISVRDAGFGDFFPATDFHAEKTIHLGAMMGNLILCHDKHATHPYEITRIHCRIFTMEELCYYLCNNLYLIDYTIMNEQICNWLEEEIGMKDLADQLRDVLRLRGSVEKFVLTILKASRIYRDPEMIRIQNVLEHLKNQKDIERQKYKGDNLLESGEIEEAILVYQEILNREKDESVDEKFYGKIYAGLGAAYGRLFLYQESARMYDRAYQICEDPQLLKPYLYAFL